MKWTWRMGCWGAYLELVSTASVLIIYYFGVRLTIDQAGLNVVFEMLYFRQTLQFVVF